MKDARSALIDIKIHVKIRISALWASVMFCYIYGDYLGLYVPGQIAGMLQGQGPIGSTSQATLAAVAILMAVPAVMIFLSLVLPAELNRWVNIAVGVILTVIVLITMPGAWAFYILLSTVEVALQLVIVWYAWNWPRQEAA
ncbi:MAG: DUF6326 family protein [Gemmatimonadota bacterium]|nr:DUF6326 family protein [Gemmatimonadota bacterium]